LEDGATVMGVEVADVVGDLGVGAEEVEEGAEVVLIVDSLTCLARAYGLAGTRGGTEESFDWELLADRRSEVPLILAGGLTPDNVDEAIAAAHPFAVDVASGVESAPGIKDHGLMAAFAERAQAVPA